MKQFRYVVNGKPCTEWHNAVVSIFEVEKLARSLGNKIDWQIEYREV